MTLSSPVRSDAGVVPRGVHARRAIGLACLLTALAPVPVSAVGIGAITQQSALGQSLRVVVPVTLGEGEAVSPECFRIAAAEQDADGIPQLLFGRVNVERSSAGTNLVITNPRPVNDPVVRLTIQAGCESAVRREYTLFMDPPAIETPVVAAEAAPREAVVAPRPAPATRESRRPVRPAGRSSTRPASPAATGDGSEAARKGPADRPRRCESRAETPAGRGCRPTAAFVVQWRAWYGDRSRRHRGGPRKGTAGASGRDRSRDAGPAPAHRGAHRARGTHAAGNTRAGNRGAGDCGSSQSRAARVGNDRVVRTGQGGVRTGESGIRTRHRGARTGQGGRRSR